MHILEKFTYFWLIMKLILYNFIFKLNHFYNNIKFQMDFDLKIIGM